MIQYELPEPIQTVWVTAIGVGIYAIMYYFLQGGKISSLKKKLSFFFSWRWLEDTLTYKQI